MIDKQQQSDGSYLLWPEGVPTAGAVTTDQVPRIVPYPVKSKKPTGAVIVLPGGGYGGLAPHEGEPVARWLNSEGIAAFVLYYRVAPNRFPAPLLDAQRGLRFVRHNAKEWNINPGRIGILGFSAGGHLASTTATHFDDGIRGSANPVDRVSCRPDAAVLCYPVITIGKFAHHGSFEALLGKDPPSELLRSLSTDSQVTAQTPPAFLWHTGNDGAVPVQNSMMFADALSRAGVPFELHVFPKGDHGMGLAENDPVVGVWPKLCGVWLKGMGF